MDGPRSRWCLLPGVHIYQSPRGPSFQWSACYCARVEVPCGALRERQIATHAYQPCGSKVRTVGNKSFSNCTILKRHRKRRHTDFNECCFQLWNMLLSDKKWVSPYNITICSNKQVITIMEMLTKDKISSVLITSSQVALKEMHNCEENKDNGA